MRNAAFDRVDHTRNVLVLEHGEDRKRVGGPRQAREIGGECTRRVRIVGDIEYHGRPARKHLKTTGEIRQQKSAADILRRYRQAFAQTIERSDARRGVCQLISAAQRRVRQAVALAPRPPIAPLGLPGHIAEIAIDQHQFGADGGGMCGQCRRRLGVGADRGPAGAKYPRFLESDRLARVTEVSLMIEIDAGHQRAVGVECVDRVEAAAQPHFEYRHFDVCLLEGQHRSQRAELEISQQHLACGQPRGFDARECAA